MAQTLFALLWLCLIGSAEVMAEPWRGKKQRALCCCCVWHGAGQSTRVAMPLASTDDPVRVAVD
jgi:hypothetical protein